MLGLYATTGQTDDTSMPGAMLVVQGMFCDCDAYQTRLLTEVVHTQKYGVEVPVWTSEF